MRFSKPWSSSSSSAIALLAATILPTTTAIFADEASLDFSHTLLGIPDQSSTFFHKPSRKGEKAAGSLLYTLSDVGVLGAVQPGTGEVVWRQFLGAAEEKGSVRANGEEVVSVFGPEAKSWDAASGKERWGNKFDGVGRDVEVLEGVGAATDGDVLVLHEEGGTGVTRRLDKATGDVVWEHRGDGADLPVQVSTDVKSVFVVSLHGKSGGYSVKVEILDPVTGKKLDEHSFPAKSDITSRKDITFVGANSAAPIVAWIENGMKSVKVNILGTKSVQTLPLAAATEEVQKVTIHAPRSIQSQPHFLVHSQSKTAHWAEVYHINLKAGTISEAYHLPKLAGNGAFSTSEIDANVYFTRNTPDEVIVVGSASHAILGRWVLAAGSDKVGLEHGVSEVVKTQKGDYAVRAAVVTNADDWLMIRNGAPAWTRSEGLSGAVAAAWADIPVEENLAEVLQAEAHSNPVSAYFQRVNRHISELQYLPGFLASLPQKFMAAVLPGDTALTSELVRDTFGFRKLVIIATERGRVYALDSANKGKIVWTVKAFDIPSDSKWDVKALLVEPQKGTVTIRGSEGEYVILKILDGANIETMWRGSWPAVRVTALVDSESGPWIMPIWAKGDPGPLPHEWAPQGVVVVRTKDGGIRGLIYKQKGHDAHPEEIWSFSPAAGETVSSIKTRPLHDPVASIGRALADRTVLYKFLNPNIVLITAVSASTSSISIYLLDSSSGAVLYTTSHSSVDITKPMAADIVENAFAYSFFSDVSLNSSLPLSKGYQLVVNELYESDLANDRGPLGATANFSGLLPSENPSDEIHLPHIKSASFLIPQPVSLMATTSTLQGITTKSLLLYLPNSKSIASIPRPMLDPRRPAGRAPTKLEQEEGLLPYIPAIEFDPKLIITHVREVIGVRGIITEPALIESTSLVVAYGVDVWGTRIAPSGSFDVLGKDFNKLSLLATVVGLTVGVAALAPMVREKTINGRWRTA